MQFVRLMLLVTAALISLSAGDISTGRTGYVVATLKSEQPNYKLNR